MAFYWRNWPEQNDYWVGLTLLGRMFVNHGLYRRSALDEVGFADEETYAFYHADGDLGLKMWDAGYVCIASSDSYVEHYSHANLQVRTSNLMRQKEDWDNYVSKWQRISGVADVLAGQGWVTRAHVDPGNTAKQFLKIKGVATGVIRDRAFAVSYTHLAAPPGLENFNFPGSRGLLCLMSPRPGVVHCHNLHGGYFDLRFLPKLSARVPTLLTLHDAWLLGGPSAHSFGCERWTTGCGPCPDFTIPPAIPVDLSLIPL